ncbi:SH3 domain-containing protein [Salipiger aestuarii]|uniref:SH3 domain-containing protein n=1 Tax=Salipiger aestuarii TaxID=568098 RepID=UPI00123C0537|nr:SH3 domain-containing protein [Salipiger aestuarii]KAA8610300.1 hypothetical protein AL037_13770 [Salipiger aestuarii]
MKSFILLTFAFLGWSWYELSGGADFNDPNQLARADTFEKNRLPEVARADIAADSLLQVARPTAPDGIVLASADAQPAAGAVAAPKLGVTLASAAQMPLARPSKAILAKVAVTDSGTDNTATGAAPDLRRVTGNVVNMRTGPGTDYAVIDQLRRDARVVVLAESDDGWVKLRTAADDRIGWMSRDFLRAAVN